MMDVMDEFMSAKAELEGCDSKEVMESILRVFGIVIERNTKSHHIYKSYDVYKNGKLIYGDAHKYDISRLLTYVIQNFSIKFLENMDECMSRQETLDILFPPTDAESIMELMANMGRNEIEKKPVMVDSTGQRNIVSCFDSHSRGKATHDNLLDVIPVEGEEV